MAYIELKDAITWSEQKKITDGIRIAATYTDAALNIVKLANITYTDFNDAVRDIISKRVPAAAYATPYTEPHISVFSDRPCPVIAISVNGARETDYAFAPENYTHVSSGQLRDNTFYNVVDYSSVNIASATVTGVKLKGNVPSKNTPYYHYILNDYVFTTDDATQNINYNLTHIDFSDCTINVDSIQNDANFRTIVKPEISAYLVELNSTFFYEDRGMYSGITYLSMPNKFYTLGASNKPYESNFVSNVSLTPYTSSSPCMLYSTMFATYVDTIDLSNLDFKYADETSVTYLFDKYASDYTIRHTYVNTFKLPRNVVTYWSGIWDNLDNRVGYLNLFPYYINDNDSLYEIANLSFNHTGAHKNYCYIYVNSATLARLQQITYNKNVTNDTNIIFTDKI